MPKSHQGAGCDDTEAGSAVNTIGSPTCATLTELLNVGLTGWQGPQRQHADSTLAVESGHDKIRRVSAHPPGQLASHSACSSAANKPCSAHCGGAIVVGSKQHAAPNAQTCAGTHAPQPVHALPAVPVLRQQPPRSTQAP